MAPSAKEGIFDALRPHTLDPSFEHLSRATFGQSSTILRWDTIQKLRVLLARVAIKKLLRVDKHPMLVDANILVSLSYRAFPMGTTVPNGFNNYWLKDIY